MELNNTEELKAHLMATNVEFQRLADEHAKYARKIEDIEQHAHVTPEDEIEEQRLKKLKLHCKDQMEIILNRYRAEQVA